LNRLFSSVPDVVRSISATTRSPRPGESEGVDYFYLTRDQFEADITQGLFLEYAIYGTNLYGTPLRPVVEQREKGLDVFLEIEVQGAEIVRRLAPDAILIYIQPPALKELERRLRHRKTETEEAIQLRLATAAAEQQHIPLYDYLITNDDLDTASEALRAIVVAERHRLGRAPVPVEGSVSA
jgi:guanylate kinase